MAKTKPLLPSLRENKRYLVFKVISKGKLTDFSKIAKAIELAANKLLGFLGVAKAGIVPLRDKWNQRTQTGIIRVNTKYVDHLKSSLSLINKIGRKSVVIRSLGVSGILKKTERFGAERSYKVVYKK
ncbi:ribonuclease P protein component 2 [Candidatus Woesearchaeota archaeon]|nr:MAG: ribonuclease P protein component 2 [Candidatus Woesearchaeota archaeon]